MTIIKRRKKDRKIFDPEHLVATIDERDILSFKDKKQREEKKHIQDELSQLIRRER